jgi:DNA polymerase III gamma/tau subunit
MTNQAMNAFLKTCEEPLPNRLIIATSVHQSQMIDTIISRSLLIKFNTISESNLKEICSENNLFVDDLKLQDFVCKISM